MQTSERHIPINYTCPNRIRQHLLHVTEVILDQYAIRIRYTATPPLPQIEQGVGNVSPVNWMFHAVDNLSNTYTDAGGAYGSSKDGRSTDGVLSLQPLPPPEASSLRVVLNPRAESEGDVDECVFDVDLTTTS